LRIVSAVCDGLFIIHCEQASSAAMLVALATVNGKDVMVYPTFPEFRNTMNNELIADGAVLVENEKDIIDTLHL
jgi:predicted Rossmann fold nucleotide-binding protein DprA/Smf involved in DNA uptake